MIIEELLDNNLIRHYSDAGMKIRQIETDAVYDEAVDVVPCRYTYAETNTPIEPEEEPIPEDENQKDEMIRSLLERVSQQEAEIADLDDYIIELMYESIIDDLDEEY